MKSKIFSISILFLSVIILALIWGCTDKYQPAPTQFAATESSCTSCHLNKTLLEEVADPIPEPSEPAGEG
jgi:nitrate/TMAO reductase-like tetraheme cytochrome c subunit